MQHLFVANGTHQIQDFHYRIPETKQPRQQKIAVGGQIRISAPDPGLSTAQIDAIIEQHRKYGLIPADEILRGSAPAPLAYRVGRHVTSEEIALLMDRNKGILHKLGKEVRENAAIVLANQLGRSAQESGTGAEFENADVEIIEVDKQGAPAGDKLNEKTVITRTDRDNPRGKDSGRRRGRGGR